MATDGDVTGAGGAAGGAVFLAEVWVTPPREHPATATAVVI